MAESKRRPRSLKGAVLIMVITILFVLIVMLLATLAVVSSTTQRTYTKYEETQAYYTARSVLEVYIDEILSSSEDFVIPPTSEGTDSNEQIIMNAMKAGGFKTIKHVDSETSAEVEGLDVKYEKDGSGNIIDKYKVDFSGEKIQQGFAYQQEIFGYLNPKYEWDPTAGAPGKDKPSDDRNWKRYDKNEDKCYMTYTCKMPEITGVAGVGKTESLDSDGEVQVRVELLRILYRNKAGEVITDNVKDVDVSGGMGNLSTLESDTDTCVDWKQTYYRLKVTATANISTGEGDDELNNEVSVSVILEPRDVPSPKGFLNAMTSRSTFDTNNHLFAIGGASADRLLSDSNYYISLRQDNMIHGDCVFRTNVYWETGAENQWILDNPNASFIIEGGVMWGQNNSSMKLIGWKTPNSSGTGYLTKNWDQSALTTDQVKKRPFIYAAGIKVGGYIGKEDQACDIILTKSGAYNNIKDRAYADLPVGADKNNLLFGCDSNNANVYGDVYCDGDMYLSGNGSNIYGNVYCTGTLYVQNTSKQYFHGDVYYGALKDSGGNALTDVAPMMEDSTRPHGIGVVSLPSSYGLPTTGTKMEKEKINLPGKKGEVMVTRVEALCNPYTYDSYKMTPPSGKTGGDMLTPVEMFEKTAQKTGLSLKCDGAPSLWSSLTSGTLSDDYGTYTGQILPASAGADINGMASFIMDTGAINGMNGTYYIDATSKDVHIQLKGESSNNTPTFVVVGNKSVFVTVDDNTNFKQTFGMFNSQIYQMYTNHEKFCFGSNPETPDKPKAPQIYYYIGDNSKYYGENCPKDHPLCGYMYGPNAKFEWYSGINENKVKYRYDQGTVNPNNVGNIGVFGSMVFGSIKTNNEFGVCFIKNDGDSSSGGAGTNIEWNKQRYLNS